MSAMARAEPTSRIRSRGLLMALGGPVVSALGLLGVKIVADLQIEWMPRSLAGLIGLAMAGGIVMTYSGAWYWITGRDQKRMSQTEKTLFFLGFVVFVVLGVVAFVMLDTATPSGPQGVRGIAPTP